MNQSLGLWKRNLFLFSPYSREKLVVLWKLFIKQFCDYKGGTIMAAVMIGLGVMLIIMGITNLKK